MAKLLNATVGKISAVTQCQCVAARGSTGRGDSKRLHSFQFLPHTSSLKLLLHMQVFLLALLVQSRVIVAVECTQEAMQCNVKVNWPLVTVTTCHCVRTCKRRCAGHLQLCTLWTHVGVCTLDLRRSMYPVFCMHVTIRVCASVTHSTHVCTHTCVACVGATKCVHRGCT